MIDIKQIHWLAGIVEGEGYFQPFFKGTRPEGAGIKYVNPRIKVTMTDEDVIRRCHAVSGVGHVTGPVFPKYRKEKGYEKPLWSWTVSKTSDAMGLMMTLYPLMGERRQARIRDCLEAWHSFERPGHGGRATKVVAA